MHKARFLFRRWKASSESRSWIEILSLSRNYYESFCWSTFSKKFGLKAKDFPLGKYVEKEIIIRDVKEKSK